MPVRFVSVLIISGWLVCSPLSIGADPPANPTDTSNQQRAQQERKQAGKLAFDVIRQSYQAKRRALDGLLAAAKAKPFTITKLVASPRPTHKIGTRVKATQS